MIVTMERIGIRELRQHASRYVAMVKAGHGVEVTERGKLVALLVPPSQDGTARDRLVAAGALRPASRSFRVPVPVRLAPGETTASETLDAQRGERLR
ncbi:MAG: type II toxin-antitoxin system Phd/YefM family antitoxin [Candidatus Dormibacteria bacterium]